MYNFVHYAERIWTLDKHLLTKNAKNRKKLIRILQIDFPFIGNSANFHVTLQHNMQVIQDSSNLYAQLVFSPISVHDHWTTVLYVEVPVCLFISTYVHAYTAWPLYQNLPGYQNRVGPTFDPVIETEGPLSIHTYVRITNLNVHMDRQIQLYF